MRIVTPPLDIHNEEGFKQDILDRKGFGESLLNLIERSQDELVISLDGKWGEGKTTFVKMWQGLLSENNIPTIYIDAFANDYIDDAFISIASSITTYAKNNIDKSKEEKFNEFKGKAKHVGVQLLSWTAKVGIKAATLGAVKESDIEELKDIKGDLAKGISTAVGDFVEERLTSHSKDVEVLESFKTLLSELPSTISNESNKPLVIIIDELDRCKPTYAVEIIEKVKHLFSVRNVIFVLVMHRKQLEEAVKSIYGQNIDAHTYLQKFINIDATLPKRISDRNINDIKKYCQQLYKLHELETWGDERTLISSLESLSTYFNLTLRQLEKVFTNISVFYASSSENSLRLTPLTSFLAVIKVINTSLFDDLLHGRVTYEHICSVIGFADAPNQAGNDRIMTRLMDWVRFALITDEEFEKLDPKDPIRDYGQSLWQYSIEQGELMPLICQNLSIFNVSQNV